MNWTERLHVTRESETDALISAPPNWIMSGAEHLLDLQLDASVVKCVSMLYISTDPLKITNSKQTNLFIIWTVACL